MTIPCLRQWPGRNAGLAPAPPGVRTGRHTDEGRPARRPVTRGGRRRRSARAARLGHARDARGDPGLHRHALRGLYHAVEHFAMHTGQIIWIAKPPTGGGARMRAGLRASNRRARHLPMRYETGLPSSVIRFRTLHASTASRRCPDELRARRQSPTIDVYRKNACSTRAC